MKKSTLLLLALPLLLPVAARAVDGSDVLVVRTSGGDKPSAIDEVRRIDFAGDKVNVVYRDTQAPTATYAFDDVSAIAFNLLPTGVEAVTAGKPAAAALLLRVMSDGNVLKVSGWDSARQATLEVFNLQGMTLARLASWHGQDVDVSGLPAGVYVVKIGNKAAKFIK